MTKQEHWSDVVLVVGQQRRNPQTGVVYQINRIRETWADIVAVGSSRSKMAVPLAWLREWRVVAAETAGIGGGW